MSYASLFIEILRDRTLCHVANEYTAAISRKATIT